MTCCWVSAHDGPLLSNGHYSNKWPGCCKSCCGRSTSQREKSTVFYWVHLEEAQRLPGYCHQESPLISVLEGHSGTVCEVPNRESPKAQGSKQVTLQLLASFILCRLNPQAEIKAELESESTQATCGPSDTPSKCS